MRDKGVASSSPDGGERFAAGLGGWRGCAFGVLGGAPGAVRTATSIAAAFFGIRRASEVARPSAKDVKWPRKQASRTWR